MEDLKEKVGGNKFSLLLKGICVSLVMTLVMIFILSMLLSFSTLKENVIMPSVIFISSFSILWGGFLVAKRIGQKGIAYGSVLGLLYMFILYVISSFVNFDFSLSVDSVVMITFGVIGGAIGGVLGVNLK